MPAARLLLTLAVSCAPLLPATASAAETGLAGMHAWRTERGKTCLADHFHTGEGEGSTKTAARKAAIADWEGFTAFEYGGEWARFRRAGSRGVRYDKTAAGWRASVEARPCRSRVRSSRRR